MTKEQWLNKFIFGTSLIDNSFLSPTEILSIKAYLQDNQTYEQIGKEMKLSDQRISKLIENGMGKILLNTKGLIAKNILLQKTFAERDTLQKELASLKFKFKRELGAEKQLTLSFEEDVQLIANIPFSVRARKVLQNLNIKTPNQLSALTKGRLTSIQNVGVKTVEEIIQRAAEVGIKIL